MRPIVTTLTNKGDKNPQTGQKVTMTDIKQTALAPVATGIMFGQYISHGTVTLAIYGNQTAK